MKEKEYNLKILQDPMLLDRIVLDGLDSKIVEEDEARKVIFICSMGHLVKNGNNTSYNLLVNSESGVGKDHVVNNVLNVFPKERVIKRTRISPTVLNYWHNSIKEPSWTWDGKILYLEDCSNNVFNHEVFKVMCSSGSQVTITINQVAVDLEINGKPTIIVTSASASPNAELLRRFVIVNLTEDKEQTRKIMQKCADYGKNGNKIEQNCDYHNALKYLHPVDVIIPFADKLVDIFPIEHVLMRTHFTRFLDWIKASAALHQHQRKRENDIIIANGKDYDIARIILMKVSSNPIMIPLTKNQRNILDIMKNLAPHIEKVTEWVAGQEAIISEIIGGHSLVDLEPEITFIGYKQLRRELDKLVNWGFLKKIGEKREGSRRLVMAYSYIEQIVLNIPKWVKIDENNENNEK